VTSFVQDAPRAGNPYTEDRLLQAHLRRVLPESVLDAVEPGLARFGDRVLQEVEPLGVAAEASPPVHVPFDAWGNRIDRVDVPCAWVDLERISAEEGLVAVGYERTHGRWSRVHQFARNYLFSPASAVFACPLAMTDGAARLIEHYGDAYLKDQVLPRLISRDPDRFWVSGQWMTERTGGSDVGGTETVARQDADGYRLYGNKWFASAVTAPVAMTLARIEGAPEGSRGLSLFFVKVFDDRGRFRNVRVVRLKDKVGTRALPTAELELDGVQARLVGGPGHGVRKIATLFNITRIYNSIVAVSFMRKAVALARDYAHRRRAFGRFLQELPAHVETLAGLEVAFRGSFALTFHLAELLGKEEAGEASEDERALLRLFTPICKLYTARQAVDVVSEAIECIGGAGYLEESGLGALLRDVHVLPIWEGTTNILALDTLRALRKEDAYGPFVADTRRRLDAVSVPQLEHAVAQTRRALEALETYMVRAGEEPVEFSQAGARFLAWSMAEIHAAALLLDHARWALESGQDEAAVLAARRWCDRLTGTFALPDLAHRLVSRSLALEEPVFSPLGAER